MSCKDGHNKGQKLQGFNKAEEIKRWPEYTEIYKEVLMTWIIMMM